MQEVSTWQQARSLGLKTYFTGKACPKGHISISAFYIPYSRHKHIAYSAARKAAKLQATPGWVNFAAIDKIYKEAKQKGLSVDHIIPLQGASVCGLHVANNLQIMPLADNLAKGNRFAEEWV